MSLESSIATLTQQAGLLMDLPNQVNTAAQTQIAAIGAAYQARLATLSTSFHVDAVIGLDTNAGTPQAPLKTINKALALTPRGGRCKVYLLSDYTIAGGDILIDGKSLVITSGTGGKPNLYFERYIAPGNVYRGVRSFSINSPGHLALWNLTINVPALDAGFAAQVLYNQGLVNPSDDWAPISLQVYACSYVIPATPYCKLFPASAYLFDFNWYGNTLPGAITSLNGQVSDGQASTAGAAAAGFSWIRTNLTNI